MYDAALWVYFALLTVVAAPLMPFSRMAAVVVGLWAVAHLVIMAGAPYAYVQMTQYSTGALIGWFMCKTRACHVITSLYLALAVINASILFNGLHQEKIFWLIYSCAMLQILALPMGADWDRIKAAWGRVSDMTWVEQLLRLRHG